MKKVVNITNAQIHENFLGIFTLLAYEFCLHLIEQVKLQAWFYNCRCNTYPTDGFTFVLCSGFLVSIVFLIVVGLHSPILMTFAAVILWIWMIASDPQSIVRTGLLNW